MNYMKNLTQEEWVDQIKDSKDTVILDVRTPEEWNGGIIKDAQLIDLRDIERFIEEVDKMDTNKSYFIYCRSGNRSGQACQYMDSKGFTKTFNLLGGILEWEGELNDYNHEL